MNKPEALVDTCFLHKFSKEGKNIELMKEILQNLDFQPVIHPYIYGKMNWKCILIQKN